jgi:hypothetical protein
MNHTTYADILCQSFPFATGCTAEKRRGTLVKIGPNDGPVFEIVSIEGPTAWIRQPRTYRGEALVPVERLRVVSNSK